MNFLKNLWAGFYNCMHAAIWILLCIGGVLAIVLAKETFGAWPVVLYIAGPILLIIGIVGLAAIGAGMRVLEEFMNSEEDNK